MKAAKRTAKVSLLVLSLLCIVPSAALAQRVEALIIGGGPEPQANQVAIENHVRYLLRLLPGGSHTTVLFADGDPKAKTVLFERKAREMPAAEKILTLLLQGPESWRPATLQFRAPSLARIDGPAKKAPIEGAFDRLKNAASADPLLLYFAGHGSPGREKDLENNNFDLWGEQLCVRDLARNIAGLPTNRPLAIVMVQCYSGAFGNLLFRDGDPAGEAVDRDIAGFFATVKEKMAAGCTPAVDERDYQDFSTHFFAALSGKDRVGRAVSGADYNRDGRVGMDEAFCYTLVHNATIDIPVCTSDVFLRRFITTPDSEIFKTTYAKVREWGTPAQKAVLDELSVSLGLTGDDRLQKAWAKFQDQSAGRQLAARLNSTRRGFMVHREEERNTLFARWPDLKDPQSRAFAAAKSEALPWVRRRAEEGNYKGLLGAEKRLIDEEDEAYRRELAEAKQIRFVRLAKTVILSRLMRESEDETLKRRFEKLVAAEQRSLLPWQGPARAARFTR